MGLYRVFRLTLTRTKNNNKQQAECENSALLKLFIFYVFDIVLAYTIAGSFLSKLKQFTQLIGERASDKRGRT